MLEALVHAIAGQRADFKVLQVSVVATPRLRLFCRDDSFGALVRLVAKHNEGELLRVLRRVVLEELFSPHLQRVKGLFVADVENEEAAVCAAVEGLADRLVSFSTASVPDLQSHGRVLDSQRLCQEACFDRRLRV